MVIEAPARPDRSLRPAVSGKKRVLQLVGACVGAALVGQAVHSTHFLPQELVSGVSGMADIVRRSLPPDVSVIGTGVSASIQTFDIALLGTLVAVVVAFPIGVCGAENLTPWRPLYYLCRAVIGVFRSVPDLIWALFFVAAVGLGPLPGILALTVHSVGMLGRLFAETFEEMSMGPVHALTVTGASRGQLVSHAVVPITLPTLISVSLYRFDENVRTSLVLGFVGAGGIGFQIYSAMQLFQYQRVAMYIILTFVVVFLVEMGSARVRRYIH